MRSSVNTLPSANGQMHKGKKQDDARKVSGDDHDPRNPVQAAGPQSHDGGHRNHWSLDSGRRPIKSGPWENGLGADKGV